MAKYMQVVYKCDRCPATTAVLNGALPEGWEYVKHSRNGDVQVNTGYEVCTDCAAELERWIRIGENG